MDRISRRDLLVTGSAVLAGTLVRNDAEAATVQTPAAAPPPQAPAPPASAQKPADATAAAPGEPYLLECKWIEKTIAGTRVRMRSYNGTVPGPMLKTRPGDTLRVRIKNSLTPYDSTGWNGDHNVPHDLNTTNLHLHGLDTKPHLFEPQGTTNPLAPMVAIAPNGGTYDYALPIPADHPPGLYWYHPHHHGSTAVQAE
jgi:suppressor of ftsI